MWLTRRKFLGGTLAAGGAAWLGCGCSDGRHRLDGGMLPPEGDAAPEACDDADPFAGGELLATLPLIDSSSKDYGILKRTGLDARQYFDLTTLGPGTMVVPNDLFFVRTSYPDLLGPPDPWTIRVHGLVSAERDVTLADLAPFVAPRGAHLIECSGNGTQSGMALISAAEWAGARLDEVVRELVDPLPAATQVLVSGFDGHSAPTETSTPGASWVYSWAHLEETGAFLATEMNGAPLPPHHGEPVRLLVPGWYGCTCIKWVNEIRLVGADEPATSQMVEFANRTHQPEVFDLARDYLPAEIDQAAMPVRVERWTAGGNILHRVAGILWGGKRPTDALAIRFDDGSGPGEWQAVDVCPAPTTNATWTLWSYAWTPPGPGRYDIALKITDPSIRTRRLDAGHYVRAVEIE